MFQPYFPFFDFSFNTFLDHTSCKEYLLSHHCNKQYKTYNISVAKSSYWISSLSIVWRKYSTYGCLSLILWCRIRFLIPVCHCLSAWTLLSNHFLSVSWVTHRFTTNVWRKNRIGQVSTWYECCNFAHKLPNISKTHVSERGSPTWDRPTVIECWCCDYLKAFPWLLGEVPAPSLASFPEMSGMGESSMGDIMFSWKKTQR